MCIFDCMNTKTAPSLQMCQDTFIICHLPVHQSWRGDDVCVYCLHLLPPSGQKNINAEALWGFMWWILHFLYLIQTHAEPPAPASSCKVDSQQPVSAKPSVSQPISNKPALPKKPDVHGDPAGKSKRISGVNARINTQQGHQPYTSCFCMSSQK